MTTEHLQLDSMGILKQVKFPPELAWLANAEKEKELLLDLFLRGGLTRKEAAKFEERYPEAYLALEIRNMLEWDTDKFNRKLRLILTWKGRDAAEILVRIALNENNKKMAATMGQSKEVKSA